MFSMALLFVRDATADQAMDRWAAFHKAHPTLAIDFAVSVGTVRADAHMVLDRQVRLAIRFQAPRGTDRIAYTPAGYVEVNDASKTYDEYHGAPTLRILPSRISAFAQAVPTFLIPTDIRSLFLKSVEFKATGKEDDFGVSCDVLHTHISAPSGQVDLDIAIDPTGRIRRIKSDTKSRAGDHVVEWKFSHVDPLENPPASLFTLDAPLGYVPFALHDRGGPISAGAAFPTHGWRAAAGGTLDVGSRLGAHGGLVAILGADSEPSERARASLERLRAIVPVVTLSEDTHAVTHTDGYDPSGKLIDAVSPPDTPLFLLLNGSGKVIRLWMGYDPGHAAAFEGDVRKTYSGL